MNANITGVNCSGPESYSYSGASRYSYSYSKGLTMAEPIFDHDRRIARSDVARETPAEYNPDSEYEYRDAEYEYEIQTKTQ